MLLPITIEHVIDEKSPLYRHTHESLVACGAEVVVSFEGQIDTTVGPYKRLVSPLEP